tara:strand:- start:5348 stop:5716 length:369 start_codon:yes stop_codon:yes gene_type:complete
MTTNLPNTQKPDSSNEVKQFYNQYYTGFINFPSNEVDAVIGFFQSRGFEKTSAIAVGTAILQQAKIDDVNVFELIDTLKKQDTVQLSNVVTEILNYNRQKISTLGYKISNTANRTESRNIEV